MNQIRNDGQSCIAHFGHLPLYREQLASQMAAQLHPLFGMMQNVEIARRVEEVADLLEAQRDNPFRVQAYRRAAAGVRHWNKPLAAIWQEQGNTGLRAVTGV